jgi:alpha-glucosidase
MEYRLLVGFVNPPMKILRIILGVAWILPPVAVATLAASPASAGLSNLVAGRDRVAFSLDGNRVSVELCRPNLVKVSVAQAGQTGVPTPSIAQTTWAGVDAVLDVQADPIVLKTSQMVVEISRATGHVSVRDPAGHWLIGEHAGEGVYQTWQKGVHFTTRAGSHFYGVRGWAYLDDSRGQMEMAPSAQPYPIQAGAEGYTGGPFLWSNRGYGVFLNTDAGFCYIRDDTDVRFYGLSGTDVTYYVAVGSAYAVQEAIAELTGKPPMFPKWAMGFSNSEFADMNEARCAANVAGYRARGIPIDLYTFDFQWKDWGDDHYGEMRWNPVNFPNGPSGRFKQRMAAQGIKLAGIMKPRIHVDSEQGRYATAHQFWVKGRMPYPDYFSGKLTNDLDFSIPECRQWFWEHARGAFESGIVGWWNDEADAWGSVWEGMYMAEALYDGQRAFTRGQTRVWTNNRNFFSGAQRYAYATWSGDIESGFGIMQQQRERLLCSVNVGQARWGMDTGGFNNNYHIQGEELNEAFARWMEFAAFVPIFRTHGTSYRQPWLYGPKAEAAARKADRLRYALLPYLYSYEHRLHETGIGLVHPLVWDFPDEPAFANDVEAWMFGDYFLVAPVVQSGQTLKRIALPPGVWIDYFRGDRLAGGRTIDYPIDAATWQDIPLFVKSGAIIPSIEVQDYVGERPVTAVAVDVFPDAAPARFEYYDDDGTTYDYEAGADFIQSIEVRRNGGGTRLVLGARRGTFSPDLQWYTFKIHAAPGGSVTSDDRPLATASSLAALAQSAEAAWTASTDRFGPVTYVKVRAGSAQTIQIVDR